MFQIPVMKLVSPATSRLIRTPDETFIEMLKAEMLTNRMNEVSPIIGVVQLKSGELFHKENATSYMYECIGGNHTRIALQQLINENKSLASDKHCTCRSVSVYVNLTDEQAQHVAHRHNRATEFVNKMITQDKVCYFIKFSII